MESMEYRASLAERIVPFLKRASIVGLMISLIVHICLAVISYFVSIDRSRAATAEPFDNGFEFAMMTEEELTELQDSALMLEDPSVPEIPVPEVMDLELLDSPDTADLPGVFDDI